MFWASNFWVRHLMCAYIEICPVSRCLLLVIATHQSDNPERHFMIEFNFHREFSLLNLSKWPTLSLKFTLKNVSESEIFLMILAFFSSFNFSRSSGFLTTPWIHLFESHHWIVDENNCNSWICWLLDTLHVLKYNVIHRMCLKIEYIEESYSSNVVTIRDSRSRSFSIHRFGFHSCDGISFNSGWAHSLGLSSSSDINIGIGSLCWYYFQERKPH